MGKLLLFFLVLSSLGFAHDLVGDQHIIQFKSNQGLKEFVGKVDSRKIEVAARGDAFIVVRPKSFKQQSSYLKFIQASSQLKEIDYIKEDKVIYPEDESQEVCVEKKESDGFFGLAKFFAKEPPCLLDHQCHGKNLGWAKYLIDADLAEKEVLDLVKVKGNKNIATVAVVDSGFNYVGNSSHLIAENVNVARGFDQAGNPYKDEGGHGTAVSGMISAKGVGVTSSINLNIYRTTEGGSKGTTTMGFLAASIEKACQESDIVNVSWGSDMEELGYGDIEKELWYRKAQKMGCLIIKSSGNAGIKKKVVEKKIPEDAPVLMVGAINNQGREASFSTSADIKAPGEGVFTLVSDDVANQSEYEKKKVCEVSGVKYAPINGTSFSSPMVAGVAGQVVTVLKLNNALPKDPIKKIRLIKNILSASAMNNDENLVNAYRAVKIAGMIKASDILKSPSELSDGLDRAVEARCLQAENCPQAKDCLSKRNCFNNLRNKMTLCRGKEDRRQLIALLNDLKEFDLLAGYLPLLEKGDLSEQKIDEMLAALWENNLSDPGVVNIRTAFSLMKLAKKLGRDQFIDSKKFQQIFKSSDFWWEFNVREEIGENVWKQSREQSYPELIELFSYLPVKDQKNLIDLHRVVKPESLSFLLIAQKYNEKLSKDVRRHLSESLDSLSDDFLSGNLMKDISGYQLDQSPVIDLLVKNNPRGKEIVRGKLNAVLSKSDVKFMAYALASKQIFSPEEKIEVSREVLRQASQKPQELKYATEQAIKILMESDQESDADLLKKTLLTNPYTEAGYEFHKLWSRNRNAKKKLLGDQNFWSDYLQFSLENTKKFIKGDLPIAMTETGSAIKTFGALIETNAIDDEEKIKILKTHKEKIQEVLSEAIKRSAGSFLLTGAREYEARDAIEKFSEHFEWLKQKNIYSDQDIEELQRFVRKNKNLFSMASRNLDK